MSFHTEDDILALFQHSAWMKRVALRLLGDEQHAEDAVQDSLAVALEKAPDDTDALRRWLAVALKFRIRKRWAKRSRGASGLKAEVEAGDVELSPVETLMKAEAMEAMLQGLFNLTEPYRTTVSLYFLEGKTAAEVGRIMGAPEPTVRTRIKRGLEALRASLEQRYGELWPNGCLAVLGLSLRPGTLLPPSQQATSSPPSALRRWVTSGRAVVLVLGGVVVASLLTLRQMHEPTDGHDGDPNQATASAGVTSAQQPDSPQGFAASPVSPATTGSMSTAPHEDEGGHLMRLAIRAATLEGTPLWEALPHGAQLLGAMGLPAAWQSPLPELGALPSGLGIGVYRGASPPARAADEEGGGTCLLGFLDIDLSLPPALVALAYRQGVLQALALEDGVQEVVFRLDPADVRQMLSRVVVRVADMAPGGLTLHPQISGGTGREWLWHAQATGLSQWAFDDIPPGWLFIQVRAEGRATVSRFVACSPGSVCDLGTVVLDQALALDCQVVLPSGEPAPFAELEVLDLTFPHWRLVAPFPQRYRVEEHGTFQVGRLGTGDYQVQARFNAEGQWLVSRPVRRQPGESRADVRLPLEESVMAMVVPQLGELDQVLFLLEDSLGRVLWAQWMTHASRGELWAPPGAYVLRAFTLDDREVYRHEVALLDPRQAVVLDPAVRLY